MAKDHSLVHLLGQEDVLAGDDLGPDDGRAPIAFARGLRHRSRPVMDWMDAHVGPSETPPEACRAGR